MDKANLKDLLNTPLYWVGQETQDACEQLDTYLTALGDHIDTVRAQYRLRADRKHKNRLAELDPENVAPSDYEKRKECEYLYKVEKEWYEKTKIAQDRTILQTAWNSFIVSCWATYEMYFERLADYVRKKKEINEKPDQKSRLGKMERLMICFRDILGISIPIEKDDIEYLENLYSIRNAIAHYNGRIDKLSKKKQKRLNVFISEHHDVIELEGQYLRFGRSFATEAMAIVTRTLKQINNAVRQDLNYFLLR